MRKLLLLFLFILIFAEADAQFLKQLTFNNIRDAEVSMYKNRIVWSRGNGDFADIFLAENDTIRQLTYANGYNFLPEIGSKYIVWIRQNRGNSSLIYYDGFTERELDRNNNHFRAHTVENYIVWWKMKDASIENFTQHLMLFDGEKTQVIAQADRNNIIYYPQITGHGIMYVVCDSAYKKAKLGYHDFKEETIIDSINNGYFLPLYPYYSNFLAQRRVDKPLFLYHVTDKATQAAKIKFYAAGKLFELPDTLIYAMHSYNIVCDAGKDFLSILSHKRGNHWENPTFKIWRNNTLYTISEHPFTEVNNTTELYDISTFFSYTDSMQRSFLYVYQGGRLTQLASGYNFNYWPYQNFTGKSIAWAISSTNSYLQSEIFYYCGEDSCINAVPLQEFKAKIYYKMQAKQITVEIETPLAEKFRLEIYDLLGRKVAETNFVSLYGKFTFLFPTETIKQGMYLVKLQNPSKPAQQLTQKLFIPN